MPIVFFVFIFRFMIFSFPHLISFVNLTILQHLSRFICPKSLVIKLNIQTNSIANVDKIKVKHNHTLPLAPPRHRSHLHFPYSVILVFGLHVNVSRQIRI